MPCSKNIMLPPKPLKDPIPVSRFMEQAVRQYYASRSEPFGEKGDFTTAPEISQVFGELLGAFAAQTWLDIGRPERLTLLELGPGRGTLMADLLRATAKIEGFHAALDIVLLENSEALRAKQSAVLGAVRWIETLSELNPQGPVIAIGNEFLDALPISQIIRRAGEWRERAVSAGDEGLAFTDIPAGPQLLSLIPKLPLPKEGDILELAPERLAFAQNIFALLKRHGGASLFVDYGYDRPFYGDTLQALKHHQFTPVLAEPGEADITAHVDFAALKGAAEESGLRVEGPIGQGLFLLNLGAAERAEALMRANPSQAHTIEKALHRLTHSAEMGTLFKVIGFTHGFPSLRLAGFA